MGKLEHGGVKSLVQNHKTSKCQDWNLKQGDVAQLFMVLATMPYYLLFVEKYFLVLIRKVGYYVY